jgi:hypothetical protein
LREPPTNEFGRAVRAMYSEAITGNVDLKALLARTANLVNTNYLAFGGGAGDRERLRRYLDARTAFYRRYYPGFYEQVWREKLRTVYRLP